MVAIKDMEMPKNCAECNMTTCKGKDELWNYVCSINLKDIDFNEKDRAEHCPLVEIVTCEYCEYWDKYEEYCKKLTNTMGWSEDEYYQVYTDKDFYCADGERKMSDICLIQLLFYEADGEILECEDCYNKKQCGKNKEREE